MTCAHVNPIGYMTGTKGEVQHSAIVCRRTACFKNEMRTISGRINGAAEFVPMAGVGAAYLDEFGFLVVRDGPYDVSQGPRCRWICDDDLRCDDPATDHFGSDDTGLPVCADHLVAAIRFGVAQMYNERDSETVARGDGLYAEACYVSEADARDSAETKATWDARPAFVYYVQRDRWVKIGTTRNLMGRLHALGQGGVITPPGMTFGPVELLAAHPGDHLVERNLHRRFEASRVAGEWFTQTPALMAHICEVAAKYPHSGYLQQICTIGPYDLAVQQMSPDLS